MERAKMRKRDKLPSLVRIYLVESELVGEQLPTPSNKVVGLAWFSLQLAGRNMTP
jgi:hypothetical protein